MSGVYVLFVVLFLSKGDPNFDGAIAVDKVTCEHQLALLPATIASYNVNADDDDPKVVGYAASCESTIVIEEEDGKV